VFACWCLGDKLVQQCKLETNIVIGWKNMWFAQWAVCWGCENERILFLSCMRINQAYVQIVWFMQTNKQTPFSGFYLWNAKPLFLSFINTKQKPV